MVFTSLDDLSARIDSPELDVRADDFVVLQNAGPKSGYAMPEARYLPIPAKLARTGVKDMVRISDARMSGTAYGTIVLHVSPESAVGGPLALVRDGDRIRLSVSDRRLDLLVDDGELARRRVTAPRPSPPPARGYAKLYMDHVLQAEHGCDFDFLRRPESTVLRAPLLLDDLLQQRADLLVVSAQFLEVLATLMCWTARSPSFTIMALNASSSTMPFSPWRSLDTASGGVADGTISVVPDGVRHVVAELLQRGNVRVVRQTLVGRDREQAGSSASTQCADGRRDTV